MFPLLQLFPGVKRRVPFRILSLLSIAAHIISIGARTPSRKLRRALAKARRWDANRRQRRPLRIQLFNRALLRTRSDSRETQAELRAIHA